MLASEAQTWSQRAPKGVQKEIWKPRMLPLSIHWRYFTAPHGYYFGRSNKVPLEGPQMMPQISLHMYSDFVLAFVDHF